MIPPSLSVTDSVWDFQPWSPNAVGPSFVIRRVRRKNKYNQGGMSLYFEEPSGSIFNGGDRGTFHGRPQVILAETRGLQIKSDSSEGFLYDVRTEFMYGGLRVTFTPFIYTAVGSVPVNVDSDDGTGCPICLEKWIIEETVAETICKHRFHLQCLRNVQGRDCPLCRGSLNLL